jgi:hypothetical protein
VRDIAHYAAAKGDHLAALMALAHETAQLNHPDLPAAEQLESLRFYLHAIVDEGIDAEALRWPSPRRLILRVPRYVDLYREAR